MGHPDRTVLLILGIDKAPGRGANRKDATMTDAMMPAGVDTRADLAPLQVASALNQAFVACAAHMEHVVQVVKTPERQVSASDLHEIVPWAVGARYIREDELRDDFRVIGVTLKSLRRPCGPFVPLGSIDDIADCLELEDTPPENVSRALAELNSAFGAAVISGGSLLYPLDSAWGWDGFDETKQVHSGTRFRCSASACRIGGKPGVHLALVASAIKSSRQEPSS